MIESINIPAKGPKKYRTMSSCVSDPHTAWVRTIISIDTNVKVPVKAINPQDRGIPVWHILLGRVKAPAPSVAVAREKAEEAIDPGLSISNLVLVQVVVVLESAVLSPDSEAVGDKGTMG